MYGVFVFVVDIIFIVGLFGLGKIFFIGIIINLFCDIVLGDDVIIVLFGQIFYCKLNIVNVIMDLKLFIIYLQNCVFDLNEIIIVGFVGKMFKVIVFFSGIVDILGKVYVSIGSVQYVGVQFLKGDNILLIIFNILMLDGDVQ